MPVDRTIAEDLARGLVDLYSEAQTRLAAEIARRLAEGIEVPDWAQRKLDAIAQVRRFADTLLRRLDSAVADEVAQALILAHIRGGKAALDELARLQSTHPEWLRLAQLSDPSPRLAQLIAAHRAGVAVQLATIRRELPGLEALNRLAFSLTSQLRGTHLRILRWDLDVYRDVIARTGVPDVLLGLKTRRRAAQVAWEDLLSRGVTGFVDKGGRGWELASYVEMATRTATAQAAIEAHLDRLHAAGHDLVIVSNAPQECARCRPWEGKVLSTSPTGPTGTIERLHATQGTHVSVHVAGTVAEAVAAGLHHPNCRHTLSLYLPGVTRIPTHTEDPEGDVARQKLRALERQVRAERLKAAAAIDPAAKKTAEAKIRDLQAQIRDHVAATGLIRQPPREQIGVAR